MKTTDDLEPCMVPDVRDNKITCGYAKDHAGPCSFGSRRSGEEAERMAAARRWIATARGEACNVDAERAIANEGTAPGTSV